MQGFCGLLLSVASLWRKNTPEAKVRSERLGKHFLNCLLAIIPLLVGACDSPDETAHAAGKGTGNFEVLFDGNSLDGWHGYNGSDAGQRWQAEHGFLSIRDDGPGQVDLVSDGEFENFELILEWKISPAGNSGIMFNVNESPEYDTPWKTGPELQILDNDGHADSTLRHRAGDLYDLMESRREMAKPAGEWNEARLLVEDGMLRHWLNDVLVIEIQMWDTAWDDLVAGSKFGSMPGFGKYHSGHIALQDHGDVVAFRNIRIREL